MFHKLTKVKVGKGQEKVQSEKDSHSKNRGGKKNNNQASTPRKHFVSRMSSYFPNRWPLSYLNSTKNMKTHIRRQQHKNFKHQDIKVGFRPGCILKGKIGKDQEKVQSEKKIPTTKTEVGKNQTNNQASTPRTEVGKKTNNKVLIP